MHRPMMMTMANNPLGATAAIAIGILNIVCPVTEIPETDVIVECGAIARTGREPKTGAITKAGEIIEIGTTTKTGGDPKTGAIAKIGATTKTGEIMIANGSYRQEPLFQPQLIIEDKLFCDEGLAIALFSH